MKLTFNTQEFTEKMSSVFKATPKKSTLPVLEYAEFIISGHRAEVRATNQDVTIKTMIEVETDEDCSFLMHRDVMGLINTIKTDEFAIDYDPDTQRMTVLTSTGGHKFPTLNADEYLVEQKPLGDLMATFNISEDQKKNLCDTISIACSEDEFRPAMTGIYFEFTSNKTKMTATDSFRLVHFEDYAENEAEISLILPKETVDMLKMFDRDIRMGVHTVDGKVTNVMIYDNEFSMLSRVIDEQYPNYETVIPNDEQYVILEPKYLQQALNRIKFSLDESSKQVLIEVKTENMLCKISAADVEASKEGFEQIAIIEATSDTQMGFNHQLLTAFISKMQDSESVKMTFSEASRPACFFPDADRGSDRLFLLMPVRV